MKSILEGKVEKEMGWSAENTGCKNIEA